MPDVVREDTADSTVTGNGLEDQSFIPSRRRDYFIRHHIHASCGFHPHFYLMRVGGFWPERKRFERETDMHLHLVQRLRSLCAGFLKN